MPHPHCPPAPLSWDTGHLGTGAPSRGTSPEEGAHTWGQRHLPGLRLPWLRELFVEVDLPPCGGWAGQGNRGGNIVLTQGLGESEVGAFFMFRREKQTRPLLEGCFLHSLSPRVHVCVQCPRVPCAPPSGCRKDPVPGPLRGGIGAVCWATLESSRTCPSRTWRSWPK